MKKKKNHIVTSAYQKVLEKENRKLKIMLSESDSFFRRTIENIPYPVFFKDNRGIYRFCNKAFLDFNKWKEKDCIGKSVIEAVADKKLARIYHKADLNLMKSKQSQVYTSQVKDKKGRLHDVIFNKVAFSDKQGKVKGLLGFIVDITPLKNTERKLQQKNNDIEKLNQKLQQQIVKTRTLYKNIKDRDLLFRNIITTAPMGMHFYSLDNKNNLIFMGGNTAADKILGFSHRNIVGKKIEEAFPNLAKTDIPSIYKKVALKGISWNTEQISCKDNQIDGAFEVHAFRTSPGMMVATFFDISGRLESERKVLNAIIEAEEKERIRLASDLHDEIGPLLSSIKIYLSSCSPKSDAEKLEYVSRQINYLIQEAIDATKRISNAISPHLLTNHGLFAAVNSVISNINPIIAIQFSTNIQKKRFHPQIEIIYYRVINELINNTIKHAEATKIHLSLMLENRKLCLVYKDDGKGFPSLKHALNQKKGIGLYNLLNRIKTINGEYTLTSHKGQGFYFKLSYSVE